MISSRMASQIDSGVGFELEMRIHTIGSVTALEAHDALYLSIWGVYQVAYSGEIISLVLLSF